MIKLHFHRCKACGAVDEGESVLLCSACKTTEIHYTKPGVHLDVSFNNRANHARIVFGQRIDKEENRAQVSVCGLCAEKLGLVKRAPVCGATNAKHTEGNPLAVAGTCELEPEHDGEHLERTVRGHVTWPQAPASTEGGRERELTEVLEAVIKVIPGDQIQLIGPLAELRESAFYCPPEATTVLWRRATMVLAEQFGERDLDGWELQVAKLFSGRKPPASTEGGG